MRGKSVKIWGILKGNTMNDNIHILNEMGECNTYIKNMLSNLDTFEKTYIILQELLEDETKWKGKRQKKCADIHQLIGEYEKALRPMCETLQTEIQNLISNVDNFTDESALEACLGEYGNEIY